MIINVKKLLTFIFYIHLYHAAFINEIIKTLNSVTNLSDRLVSVGPDICHNWNSSTGPELLVVVNSMTNHVNERRNLRYAWHTLWNRTRDNVRIVFFVGKPTGRRTQGRLASENISTGDIVWTNVTETETYNSIKAVSWLRWAHITCPMAKFVLVIEEHVFINLEAIENFIHLNANSTNTIWGYEKMKSWPSYPGPESYCDQAAYLITGDVVEKLYLGALKEVDYIQDQNVFLTGTVAKKENISTNYISQFQDILLSSIYPLTNINATTHICNYLKKHFIFMTNFNELEWSFLVRKVLNCRK